MGLDTTHDCWHGSCTWFNRWREAIAGAAGIPLGFMEGFADNVIPSHGGSALEIAARKWLPIKWTALVFDPLHALLDHSDCDGQIDVHDLIPIAARLENLLPRLAEDDKAPTERWIKGLRLAASLNEPVEFH